MAAMLITVSMRWVLKGPIKNKSALVQMLACRRTCHRPLAELIMLFFTDEYVTRPWSVKQVSGYFIIEALLKEPNRYAEDRFDIGVPTDTGIQRGHHSIYSLITYSYQAIGKCYDFSQ